ncbi:ABC transporter permease [Xylanimonas sp. McL0601]|uniref:ABC transporter permease n=1 Tax=Xylanimonas sp. McL0601 TaxID=3414739 RepID=UPI003CEC82A4
MRRGSSLRRVPAAYPRGGLRGAAGRAAVRRLAVGTLTVVVLLAAWETLVGVNHLPEFVLPAPSRIVRRAWELGPLLAHHSLTTSVEAVGGLAVGTLGGWALAVLISALPLLGDVTHPVVLLSQTLPTVVLAPLMILWVGFGLTPKVLLVGVTVFFPVLVATSAAMRAVDAEHADMVAGLGGTRWHQLWLVRLPASVPAALSGLRIAATYAVGAAVVSEYLAGTSGLGVFIQHSRKAYAVDQIFAGLALIALLSGVLVLAVVLLSRLATPWQRPSSAS